MKKQSHGAPHQRKQADNDKPQRRKTSEVYEGENPHYSAADILSIILKVFLILVLIARIVLAIVGYFSPFSSAALLVLELSTLSLWAVTLFIALF